MGHHGNTYEQFYMPDLIERDFQSIYFGTPSQDLLIRSVARMGLSRDERAPIDLTDKQKLEASKHPELVRLREKRERCKQRIVDRGYCPVNAAKGTRLHTRYEEIKRKINNMTSVLRRKRLNRAVLDFHDSIDAIEIDKQLTGTVAPDVFTRPIVQHELRERATIAGLLSQQLDELDEAHATKLRVRFIRNLACLCHLQESRRYKASTESTRILLEDGQAGQVKGASGTKRSVNDTGSGGARKRQRSLREKSDNTLGIREARVKAQILTPIEDEDVETIQSPYPMVFAEPVCLVCIGDEQLSKDE